MGSAPKKGWGPGLTGSPDRIYLDAETQASDLPRRAAQAEPAVLRIYRSLTGIDHFFYSSVGGMVKWYEKWYMTLLIIFEWHFDCFNIIRHFVCAEGQLFLSSRQNWGGVTWASAQTSNIWLKYGVFGLTISIFSPPGLLISFWWGEKVGKVKSTLVVNLPRFLVNIPLLIIPASHFDCALGSIPVNSQHWALQKKGVPST